MTAHHMFVLTQKTLIHMNQTHNLATAYNIRVREMNRLDNSSWEQLPIAWLAPGEDVTPLKAGTLQKVVLEIPLNTGCYFYEIKIRAIDEDNNTGPFSDTVPWVFQDVHPPSAVSDLMVVSVDDVYFTVNLSWTAPGEDLNSKGRGS